MMRLLGSEAAVTLPASEFRSRCGCTLARFADDGEIPAYKRLEDLKDPASLKDLRSPPPVGMQREPMESRQDLPTRPCDADEFTSVPRVHQQQAGRSARGRRHKSRGSDALREAAARWAEASEMPSEDDGQDDGEQNRRAMEVMLAKRSQADTLAMLPNAQVDGVAELLRAAEQAEAEAAAAASRAATLRAAATNAVADLEAAARREAVSAAMVAWAKQQQTERAEEESLLEAMQAAMRRTEEES